MGTISYKYSEKLVQRVNELYHDLYGERYHDSHPEIFQYESERWDSLGRRFLAREEPLTILDIGTGTGFVPLAVAKYLKPEDVFICSDISAGILKEAEKNINKKNFACRFRFVKIPSEIPFRLPAGTGSIDIATMNSVLHHIKDTEIFLKEINRLLKPGGFFLAGHEPNSRFFRNKFLWYNSQLLNPRLFVDILARRFSTVNRLKKFVQNCIQRKRKSILEHEVITAGINRILLQEKLIDKDLLPEQIKEINDIRAWEGFRPDSLLPDYEMMYLETYNHLFSPQGIQSNLFLRNYNRLLSRLFPRSGSIFFVVLKKQEGSRLAQN